MLPSRYWSDWISGIRAGALAGCQASVSQQDDIVALLDGFRTLPGCGGGTFLENIITTLRAATSLPGVTTSVSSILDGIHTALNLYHRAYEVSISLQRAPTDSVSDCDDLQLREGVPPSSIDCECSMPHRASPWELGVAQGLSTEFLAHGEDKAEPSASGPEATIAVVDTWRSAAQQYQVVSSASEIATTLPNNTEPNPPTAVTDVNPPLVAILADNAQPDHVRLRLLGGRAVHRCAGHVIDLYVRAMANARAREWAGDDDLESISSHSSMPPLQSVSASSESDLE